MCWVAICFAISAVHLASARISDESPIANETAVMERDIYLPCDITTKEENDQAVLVMFYRNDTGTPIYTVDIRNKKLSEAEHIPQSSLSGRAEFRLRPFRKSGLYLRAVWSSDEGLYRCRVDFKKSPTRNSRIYLTVIVPPTNVRIIDETGIERSSTIGPYVLGQPLTLTCIAAGGRPLPRLTWYAGQEEIDGQVAAKNGTVSSLLSIPSLQRQHYLQVFICQAVNSNRAIPVTAAVTVNMTLPPMSIKLDGITGPVSAGIGVSVNCLVVGARPLPIVTWHLDGSNLPTVSERVLDGGNVTESNVMFFPSRQHQGKYLSCQAKTPGLLHAILEDNVKLNIHYAPESHISASRKTDLDNVTEGSDVFFTCSVRAEPEHSEIYWFHNSERLLRNRSRGIIIVESSLTIEHVSKEASGNYSCRAVNNEGEGSSKPLDLKVKFSPVCKSQQRWTYNAALNELVRVSCDVESHPSQVQFEWAFNNSEHLVSISKSQILDKGTQSVLQYTPTILKDFGWLLCWARNEVGKQEVPCVYRILPAGPPETPKNCTVLNESLDSVQISCLEAYNGGLPQKFVMEVYANEGRKLKSNVTSKSPFFTVRGLPSGLGLVIKIYSTNDKGHSSAKELFAATLRDVAEKHISGGVLQASELPSTMALYPSLTIILGVIGGILIVFTVIVLVMAVLKPRQHNQQQMRPDDSCHQILKKDESGSGRFDGEGRDPDIIPENKGSRSESAIRQPSANVSTIYGDLMAQNSSSGNSDRAAPRFCATPTAPDPPIHIQPAHLCPPEYSEVVAQIINSSSAAQEKTTPFFTNSTSKRPASYYMTPGNTYTLPHPRNSHIRSNTSTLVRRNSLFLDHCNIPPLVPPPPYASPPLTTLPSDMNAVVSFASETICITPNVSASAILSARDESQSKQFPTSFGADRMESSV